MTLDELFPSGQEISLAEVENMEWLTYADALTLVSFKHRTVITPQALSFVADVRAMTNDIPIAPELIPPEYGPPGPVQQWSGRIGVRFFTIECEATNAPHDSVLIRTGFLQNQDELGDWIVLMELQELPKSILISRPLFIESRNSRPECVVYRPDPQGWKTAVYKAKSQTEANSLIEFMMQDAWNRTCFVGKPSPPGKWAIVQGERVMSGTGFELNEALRFACDWSLRYAPVELLVKDVSGTSKEVFVVSRGRVLLPS